ncbi:MAG: ATP-binding cassette domain-containing protein [Bacillota bacterium]|nr:ATP-binding cassette domain-containing protein [Bacillota bacterium]
MLELKNVSWHVEDEQGQTDIINDISLTLEDNKFYVITGPNGGGKSTLAKLVMGILEPTSGQIIFNGQDITHMSLTERARLKIGYAFQAPPVFKGIKVKEILEIAAGDKKIDAMQLLFDVGLCAGEYIDREMDSGLSGGELKRIEIASILARDLDLALFDEPEAGIDLWSFQRLAETFGKMHRDSDMTLLIISHQERIMELADEIIVIENGKVKEITDKEAFLSQITAQSAQSGCACGESCIPSKGGCFNA